MKNKIAAALAAFAVFTGAFFMPGDVYAQDREDLTPPALRTVLSDGTLHIEADDSGCGVDAVYVGGRRVNYRVDGTVDVALEDYAGAMDETLEVYAIDFAGNRSEIVEVANPYFEAAADAHGVSASADNDPDAGAGSTSEPVAFTPDGQATVADNATDKDGKEFYTFATPQGNVFYMVIDGQRDSDNVYFLNAVTEKDLYALAEKDTEEVPDMPGSIREETACICTDRCEAGSVDASCAACFRDIGACTGKEAEPDEEKEGTDSGTKGSGSSMAVLLLFAAAAAAAGWYLKIYRPKRELDSAEDLDDLLDDGPEVNEDDVEEKARGSLAVDIYDPDINEDAAAYDDYPDNGPDGEGAGGDTE